MKTLAVALALVMLGNGALAAPSTPGQQLYQAGERAFHLQHWEEARRSFSAAYELDRKPELLYDVALATWRLAREDETLTSLQAARAAYQHYLDEATAGRRRKAAEEALAQIDAQLPKPKPAPKVDPRDVDDDPAQPLDPYATIRKLPPIPKPIIIGEPRKPVPPAAKPQTDAKPDAKTDAKPDAKIDARGDAKRPASTIDVDSEVPPRSPDELHRAPPKTKPQTPLPKHNPNLPKGMIEVGEREVTPPRASQPELTATTTAKDGPRRRWVAPVVVVAVLAAAGLAIGLGVGLSEHSSSSNMLQPIMIN